VSRPDPSELLARLSQEAGAGGYFINPDRQFALELADGLSRNIERYGYQACPCRLATGRRESDLDMICPCDYRDPDLAEYGACFCALYVSRDIADGKKAAAPVPERRPPGGPAKVDAPSRTGAPSSLPYPVWRCRVCGYLCARDNPPGICPVCRATADRFEKFM
jgi:ferredoxin-thioredoxin reductase catalytic subunit